MHYHVWGSHCAKFDDDFNIFRGIVCKGQTVRHTDRGLAQYSSVYIVCFANNKRRQRKYVPTSWCLKWATWWIIHNGWSLICTTGDFWNACFHTNYYSRWDLRVRTSTPYAFNILIFQDKICEFFQVKNVVLTCCRCAQPLCVHACARMITHDKDPVVHVRVWWNTETIKDPACTEN